MRAVTVSSMIAAAALTASAHAGIASAIFAQTGVKSAAPGMGGLVFTSFDRPYRSLNGNWIITATVNTGVTSTDEVVYTGVGSIGTFRVQEGVTPIEAGRTIDTASIDTKVAINDAGDFVFAGNLGGAVTTDDEAIIRGFAGGGFDVPIREGMAIGTPPTFTGPVALGITQDSANIANSGAVSYRGASVTGGGATSTTNIVAMRNNNAVMDVRYNATGPANLPGRNYDLLAAGDYYVDATANNWLLLGAVTGTTTDDGVIVVNGNSVIREGVSTFGGGTASTFTEAGMDASGLWWVRGSNSAATGGGDWVAAGNTAGAYSIAALTDTPITPGNTEWWDDTTFAANFFLFAQNNAGDYIVGGTTNAVNLSANSVLIYNGVLEIMREGDAVDLDGNGVLDDNAFISVFNNDDCFLDGNEFYFTGNVVDGAGTALGQAFMHITVPTPGVAVLLGLGGLLVVRRRR